MPSLRLRRPSIAEALAFSALMVALGAPAEAARLITGAQVRNNSLTGNDVRDGSLTGADVGSRSLNGSDLSGATIRGLRTPLFNSVRSPQVADGSLNGGDVADGGIGGADVADGSIGAPDIADNAVGATEVSPNAISGDEIVDGAVGTTDVLDGGLTARDVGGFAGTIEADLPAIDPGRCESIVSSTLTPLRAGTTLADDAIVVTPPPGLSGLLQVTGRAASANTIRLTVCNGAASPVDPAGTTYRFVSIDGA